MANFLRYALAQPACVFEDITGSSSIDRSVDLGRGSRWKVLWSLLIPWMAFVGLSGLGVLAVERLAETAPWLAATIAIEPAVTELPASFIGLAAFPFAYIALTLIYLKLREHKEGLSLADLLAGAPAAGRSEPDDDPGPGPWDDATEPLPEPGEPSVGIPWSMFGARDADLLLEEDEPLENLGNRLHNSNPKKESEL